MQMLKGFDAACNTAVMSLVSINLTWMLPQDFQIELLYHIKFHHDHMKIVRENEANRFCFVLTLWPPGKVKEKKKKKKKKQYKMVEVNGASKHGRYEEIWLNSFRAKSNVQVFARQDSWLAVQTDLIA